MYCGVNAKLSHQKSRILQPSCAWSRRQNRKQRFGEYAAEHGAVLGFAASAAASSSVDDRSHQTKLACGVGVGSAGGPYSDETDEDGMETKSEMEEEDMDIDALVAHVTIVFKGGRPWPCAAAAVPPQSPHSPAPSPRSTWSRPPSDGLLPQRLESRHQHASGDLPRSSRGAQEEDI
ncbi:hypothetical protein BJV78DRAFT_1287171 [Lactifluus subvellereus]|nr:hypothetical protein BJV78DRAFT_1287171 [Lactifluus subvellereus]